MCVHDIVTVSQQAILCENLVCDMAMVTKTTIRDPSHLNGDAGVCVREFFSGSPAFKKLPRDFL